MSTVHRDALAHALLTTRHPDNPDRPLPMVRAGCAGILADALLTSGVLADAAQVRADERRKVADELEALARSWEEEADEDEGWLNGPRVAVSEAQTYPATIAQAREHVAELRRIAREVGDKP